MQAAQSRAALTAWFLGSQHRTLWRAKAISATMPSLRNGDCLKPWTERAASTECLGILADLPLALVLP
jgi:hypothetical protein